MNDKPEVLTAEQAIAMLPDGDRIHTFQQGSGVMIGANWDRQDLLDVINAGTTCEKAGPIATKAKHGLVVWHDGALFVATKEGEPT